jgi:dTDP-4-dehydrorhamnose 3,5-epimerase
MKAIILCGGLGTRLREETEYKIEREWVQEKHSRSIQKGIVRGLHFQFTPHAETKLVRCIRGAIVDLCVDLRRNSATFGKWISFELSEANKKVVMIPRGCAHGFCRMTDISEGIYKLDNYDAPEAEGGVAWNDPDLAIDRKLSSTPILSEKDATFMKFGEFCSVHH